MKYKFFNKSKSVEINSLEWISLLEAVKEIGIELEDDYTPLWPSDGGRRLSTLAYPVQEVIETQELSGALTEIYDLVTTNAPNKYVPAFAYHTLTYFERNNMWGKSVYLGCLDGVNYINSNYLALDHFTGVNARIIQDLLELCDSPMFEIDWTPLVDDNNENAEDKFNDN